ncbi:MAG: hypothetical protein KDK50_00125 [Chlamydiia bacterium]|nr:hypothetical protein [Chlamydiia bacterium]
MNADCWEMIFRYLDVDDWRNCFDTCRYFRFLLQAMIELKQGKKQLAERYPQIALSDTKPGIEEIRRIACRSLFKQFPKTPIANCSWFDLYQFERQSLSIDARLYESFTSFNYSELLALAKSNLMKNPTHCLKSLLCYISKHVHMRFIPCFPNQWPLVHALASIVRHLPKPLMAKMLSELTAFERIELIKVLYPLRFSIEAWAELGLDVSRAGLSRIVVKQMIWLKRGSMQGVQEVWQQAAYINSGLAIQKFLDHHLKEAMESVDIQRQIAWDNDKDNLTHGLRGLDGLLREGGDAILKAERCIELVSIFHQVIRRSFKDQEAFKRRSSELTKDLKQVIADSIEIAIRDLRWLGSKSLLCEADLELIQENEGLFTNAEALEIGLIFNPLRASLEEPPHLRDSCSDLRKCQSFAFGSHFRQMSQ